MFHSDERRPVSPKLGQQVQKPLCIVECNSLRGGIHTQDQLLQMYLVERRKMSKWCMNLFRRLLNVVFLKAMTVYRQNVDRKVEYLKF
jgi:hypothetical protein